MKELFTRVEILENVYKFIDSDKIKNIDDILKYYNSYLNENGYLDSDEKEELFFNIPNVKIFRIIGELTQEIWDKNYNFYGDDLANADRDRVMIDQLSTLKDPYFVATEYEKIQVLNVTKEFVLSLIQEQIDFKNGNDNKDKVLDYLKSYIEFYKKNKPNG